VGGIRLTDPAVDLALMMAIASAAADRALPHGMIALGEVGLAGELRPVREVRRRLAEAARLGFTSALVPAGSLQEEARRLEPLRKERALVAVRDNRPQTSNFAPGFDVTEVENVWDALKHIG
jgi:DNA repair protein RadA/Sms